MRLEWEEAIHRGTLSSGVCWQVLGWRWRCGKPNSLSSDSCSWEAEPWGTEVKVLKAVNLSTYLSGWVQGSFMRKKEEAQEARSRASYWLGWTSRGHCWLGVVAHSYNPSTLGGQHGRIVWCLEFEAALSYDSVQVAWQSESPSLKNKIVIKKAVLYCTLYLLYEILC